VSRDRKAERARKQVSRSAVSPPPKPPEVPHEAAPPGRRSAEERFRAAVRGPALGLAINLALVAVKVVVGLTAGSVALLADAGHSGADVLNNFLVIGALFYARRPADESHPYGHDRAEVLVAASSAHLLTVAAVFLGWESFQKLMSDSGEPSLIALWVAVATLVVKLVVTRVESNIARDVTSQAVKADARDSFADVLSALAVIVGVAGSHLGQPRMDGIGGLVIAAIILWTAVQIGITAGQELMERNLDDRFIEQVRSIAAGVEGVHHVTAITGRAHGSDLLVEIGIAVDPRITVEDGAAIAEAVRQTLRVQLPEVGNTLVELNADHMERLLKHLT
jgi:cation diffusion facilitator family transporter